MRRARKHRQATMADKQADEQEKNKAPEAVYEDQMLERQDDEE